MLFTEDNIAAGKNDEVILGPFNLNRSEAVRSFRRLADLGSSIAVFGHGNPVLSGAAAVLREAGRRLPDSQR